MLLIFKISVISAVTVQWASAFAITSNVTFVIIVSIFFNFYCSKITVSNDVTDNLASISAFIGKLSVTFTMTVNYLLLLLLPDK